MTIISSVCDLFWGDLITIPLPGGGTIGLSLMVLILVSIGMLRKVDPDGEGGGLM